MIFKRAKRIALAAVVTGVVVVAAGCSGDDGGGTTSSTDPFTTTSTSIVTELAPPTTAGDGSGQTTTTGGGTASTGTTTFIVGGQTREDYEASLPQLEKKAENSPKDLAALQELAIAQYQTERYAEAVDTYKAMLAVKDDALTRNNMANVLRDWNKTDEAKTEYEKAITLDPTMAVPYINLSALYLREQDTDKAISTLDRGIAATTGAEQQRLKDIKASTLDATGTTSG